MGSTTNTLSATPPPFENYSDEQILTELQTFKPVDTSSERNIWAFWDRGIAACKPWCQRNIISWVRRHGRRWTVRLLDMVEDSPNHYSRYVPSTHEFFPDAFHKRTMKGTHVAPHAADLLRLPLLRLYGGVWIDTGFMLFRNVDELCWDKLEDPANPLEICGFRMTISPEIGMFWNGFIAARKDCVAVKYWHEIFIRVWEGTDSTAGMSGHALLNHLPRYEVPSSTGEPPAFKYSDYVDYLAQMFCLERLRHIRDTGLDWDGPSYFAEKVLLYECVTEVYWAQQLTHWNGRRQFELLSRQRDQAEHNVPWEEAEYFVQGILNTSSTMKLSHGLVTEQREYLARIWDEPENAEADRRPGTFAAHLRWASIHFQQTRELIALLLPLREDALLTGGLLRVVGIPHPHWENER